MNDDNPSSNSVSNAPMDVQPIVDETQGTPIEGGQQAEDPPKESEPNLEGEANLETEDVHERISPNKRGLTSGAWAHFKREKINDKWKAICKHCERQLGGDTKSGTKHLDDHIRICKLRTVRGPRQSILKTLEQSSSSTGNRGQSMLVGNWSFDPNPAREELAKMVVLHEYPLSVVDHIGFKRFCGALQPLFKVISRNTLKVDILKVYDTERSKVVKSLEKNYKAHSNNFGHVDSQ